MKLITKAQQAERVRLYRRQMRHMAMSYRMMINPKVPWTWNERTEGGMYFIREAIRNRKLMQAAAENQTDEMPKK